MMREDWHFLSKMARYINADKRLPRKKKKRYKKVFKKVVIWTHKNASVAYWDYSIRRASYVPGGLVTKPTSLGILE